MNSPWVCIPILVFLLIRWEKIMMWLAGGLINIGIPSVCLDLFRFNLSGSSGLEEKICTFALSLGANSATSSAETHTGACLNVYS